MTGDRIASKLLFIAAGLVLLGLGMVWSIQFGAAGISAKLINQTVFHYDHNILQHQVIHNLRLPRALAGAVAGAAIGVSGAVMQVITRNPLAAPDTLGVNAGAALSILIAMIYMPAVPAGTMPLAAFVGGILTMALVWSISSVGKLGFTPVKLALAGVAVAALARTFSEGLILSHSHAAFTLTYLLKGSLSGIRWQELYFLIPWVAVVLLVVMLMTRMLNLLGLGEEAASGLGVPVSFIRTVFMASAVLLACSAVSVAGPITFLGLMVPHLARLLVGIDQRWAIPCSGLLGALLLVYADLLTRIVFAPEEVTVSIVLALLGAPVFIYFARSRRVK